MWKDFLEFDITKYSYIASIIFNITSYDSELDEFYVKKLLEFFEIIESNEILSDSLEDYKIYVLLANLPTIASILNWGTSIRSAFFTDPVVINTYGIFQEGKQINLNIKFSAENWIIFIEAIKGFLDE
jgi:hypothetical protein